MVPTDSQEELGAIEAELERVTSSKVFRTARRSQTFLQFVVHRSLAGDPPKEYEIALEVLGRGADYDPAVDAAVRVEASRLRSRLLEYYATEGQSNPVHIDVPKGGYGAIFNWPGESANSLKSVATEDGSSVALGVDGSEAFVSAPPAPEREIRARAIGSPHWTRAPSVASLLVGLLIFGLLGYRFEHRKRTTAAGPIRSLAVLPLQNLSGDASEEYFADGLTDELITEMAHISGLGVVSRTSIMLTKGKRMSLRQIAQQLGVDAVVEGSVVRSGGRVRVTAQLIDVRNDRHLWAQTYEEPLGDILTIQDRIVHEIAAQTQLAIAPTSPAARSATRIDPAAYDAYLRGLYFLHRREAHRSAAYFQQAITIAPTYAAAYAGLSQALGSEEVVGESTAPGTELQALAAARRAIQLDPRCGDAYAALGWIGILYDHDWPAVEHNLETALQLNPNNSLAEEEYSIYLDAMGRPEEGVTHMRRALTLDPLSFYMTRQLGSDLYFARHYDEALFYLEKAEEIGDGKVGFVDSWKSRVYEELSQLDEAEASDFRHLVARFSQSRLEPLRLTYQRDGWTAYQAAKIVFLKKYAADDGCMAYEIGESYLRLGNRDQAFLWLNRGIDKNCFWATAIPVDPILDGLRNDPRYAALLHRMHL